jgi:branched-chain amino acid transport system permease protein
VNEFLQQLINGLSLGAVYALIALGYTMVFGVLRFINFAHGDVFMLGAFLATYFHRWLGGGQGALHGAVVLACTMVACALTGIVIERMAYKPLRDRPKLTVLITAIGVSLFLEYGGQLVFGAQPKGFPALVEAKSMDVGMALRLSRTQVVVMASTAVLLLGLVWVVMRTRLGLAMRALSLSPTAAALMGVNTDVVISFTFGLGSALGGAAGVFYASLYQGIEPFMGMMPGMKAFIAAVLGGIGNLPGAALGGLILGVVETLVVGYSQRVGIPTGFRDAVAFVILILILLFRPAGLLGKSQREKV